jgi:hypothetical protein
MYSITRRHALAGFQALLGATAVAVTSAVDAQVSDYVARNRRVVWNLFEKLRQPPSAWRLESHFHEVAVFMDLNFPDSGQGSGPQDAIRRLMQLKEEGDLDLLDWPNDANVVVTPDITLFLSARRPRSETGILAVFNRPIAFGFQLSSRMEAPAEDPVISVLSVMRPFEPSICAMREPPKAR